MVFMGTIVAKGKGVGIVVSTGMHTQVGKIADRINKIRGDTKTQLQKKFVFGVAPSESTESSLTSFCIRLDRMAYILFGLSLLLAIVVFASNGWSGETEVVLYAVAIAISMIPEGLVAVVTLTMAMGVRSMAKQRALVRKLAAVEVLGTITDICSDKTGTLTQAKMVASRIWTPTAEVSVSGVGFSFKKTKFLCDDAFVVQPLDTILTFISRNPQTGLKENIDGPIAEVIRCAALCNNASISERDDGSIAGVGDPTETALQVLAHKAKLGKPKLVKSGWKILQEYSFDSNVKRMSVIARHAVSKSKSTPTTGRKAEERENVLHEMDAAMVGSHPHMAVLKGAPERVLGCCKYYRMGDELKKINGKFTRAFEKQNLALAGLGLVRSPWQFSFNRILFLNTCFCI
jgi:P-type Na+/K+ transporter